MKNILFYISTFAFLFTSCSNDSSLTKSIIGTWNCVSIEIQCNNPEFDIPAMTADEDNCITIEGEKTCDFNAIFRDNNSVTFSITVGGETSTANLTYTVNDENNSFDLCFMDGSEEICQTYQVADDSFDYIEDEGDCRGIYDFKKA